MKIRTASVADLAAVLGLWSRRRSEHASVTDRREDVERLVERDPDALRLAVRPDRRRQGIGRALVRAREESLRHRGAVRVTALVAFEDEAAAGFWDAVDYPLDRSMGRRVRNL